MLHELVYGDARLPETSKLSEFQASTRSRWLRGSTVGWRGKDIFFGICCLLGTKKHIALADGMILVAVSYSVEIFKHVIMVP